MLWPDFILFLTYFFPLLGLVTAYYFAIYLPAKLENNDQEFLHYSIKVGDRIATIGGLIGTVSKKTDKQLLLSLFDGTIVEVKLESICKKF